ncbi:MAG: helix-hairpin-helix domain-containing protein [Candidatus Cloacimonadaceae bacterium]
MKFLNKFLTKQEQKALLAICGLALLGFILGQFDGLQHLSAKKSTIPENTQELVNAVQEDKPIQIDIRTASKEELILLPGIGEKRAQDIIDYRNQYGFKSTDDLLQIKGIGEKTLANMLPSLLLFGNPQFTPENLTISGQDTFKISLSNQDNTADKTSSTNKTTDLKKKTGSTSVPKSQLTNIVNINTAGIEELCTLPGIGEVKAQAIIDYRNQNGKFNSVEDIINVKGIGPKTLEKIRSRIKV